MAGGDFPGEVLLWAQTYAPAMTQLPGSRWNGAYLGWPNTPIYNEPFASRLTITRWLECAVTVGPEISVNGTRRGQYPRTNDGPPQVAVAAASRVGEFILLGPVFAREAVTTPRRPRHFLYRTIYVSGLLLLMCTAWLRVTGTQIILNVGDMARFGTILFQILALLQLALVIFFAAMGAASNVCQEKDRRTLILLLLTRMTNTELVLGKLAASLLNIVCILAAALPVFMLTTLFGGVSFVQVMRVFGVTLASVLAAGSLGNTLALWREKTFQTLSMTALALVMWLGIWEGVNIAVGDLPMWGMTGHAWATMLSPFRAVLAAAHPAMDSSTGGSAADRRSHVVLRECSAGHVFVESHRHRAGAGLESVTGAASRSSGAGRGWEHLGCGARS